MTKSKKTNEVDATTTKLDKITDLELDKVTGGGKFVVRKAGGQQMEYLQYDPPKDPVINLVGAILPWL
jgi:hypothetical protein